MDNQYSSNMYNESQNCWNGSNWPSFQGSGNQPMATPPDNDIMNIVMSRRLGGQCPVSSGSVNSADFRPAGNEMYTANYSSYPNVCANAISVIASNASGMSCGRDNALPVSNNIRSNAFGGENTPVSVSTNIRGDAYHGEDMPQSVSNTLRADSYGGESVPVSVSTDMRGNAYGGENAPGSFSTNMGGDAYSSENTQVSVSGNTRNDRYVVENIPMSVSTPMSSNAYSSGNTAMPASNSMTNDAYGAQNVPMSVSSMMSDPYRSGGAPMGVSNIMSTDAYGGERNESYNTNTSYSGCVAGSGNSVIYQRSNVEMYPSGNPGVSSFRNDGNGHCNTRMMDSPANSANVSPGGYNNNVAKSFTDAENQRNVNAYYGTRQENGLWNKSGDDCGPPVSKRPRMENQSGLTLGQVDRLSSYSTDAKTVEDQSMQNAFKGAQSTSGQQTIQHDAGNKELVGIQSQEKQLSVDTRERCPSVLSNNSPNVEDVSFGISGFESLNVPSSHSNGMKSEVDNFDSIKNPCHYSPLSEADSEATINENQSSGALLALSEAAAEVSKGSNENDTELNADKMNNDGSGSQSANNKSGLSLKEHSFLDLFKRSEHRNSNGHDRLEDMFLKRHVEHLKLRKRSEGSLDSLVDADDSTGLDASTDRSITESPVISDGADGKHSNSREDSKKSRKQNAPKRLVKAVNNDGARSVGEFNLNNDSQETDQKSKPEKSRKQFKPQRIIPTSDKYEVEALDDSLTEKDEVDKKYDDEEEEENYYSCIEKDKAQSQGHKIPPHLASLYSYGSGLNYLPNNATGASPYLGIAGTKLSSSSWQSKLFAGYRNDALHSPGNSIPPPVQSDDLKENIEVVRKLREIRFNRYRKIAISEKKEIAAYAKVHSVSAAANRYCVSKSAVSMWTRMDFSNVDDDSDKRKKYSVLENERFEELVHRVKEERVNKFKGLSKEEKAEVSKYAKLVGVREMSRCLDIALGTVSGWMRQFPYKPSQEEDKETNADVSSNQTDMESTNKTEDTTCNDNAEHEECLSKQTLEENENNDTNTAETDLQSVVKESVDENCEGQILCPSGSETNAAVDNCKLVVVKTEPSDVSEGMEEYTSTENTEINTSLEGTKSRYFTRNAKGISESNMNTCNATETNSDVKNEFSDEVKDEGPDEVKNEKLDAMLADTMKEPDFEECYADVKDMIIGTPLDGDKFFEELFARVIKCRADKYKSLKASDKLEVVRYAKRNGVRRIAKVLGLATGTLSGWNLRYQAHLGLTADKVADVSSDSFQGTDPLNTSTNSEPGPQTENTPVLSETFGNTEVSNTQSPSMMAKPLKKASSSSVLDNLEKSEVIAIKLLLKDRYQVLLDKIDIARKIKFRNVSPYEKIEIVKCAKLVGIRPTARVLKMPIGTLSGWIAKYSGELHPAYHSEGQESPETPKFATNAAAIGSDMSTIGAAMGTPVRGMPPGWPMLGLMNTFNTNLMNAAAALALGGSAAHLGISPATGSASESNSIDPFDDKVTVLNYGKDFSKKLDFSNEQSKDGQSSAESLEVELNKGDAKEETGVEKGVDNPQEDGTNPVGNIEDMASQHDGLKEEEETNLMVQKYLKSAYAQLGIS